MVVEGKLPVEFRGEEVFLHFDIAPDHGDIFLLVVLVLDEFLQAGFIVLDKVLRETVDGMCPEAELGKHVLAHADAAVEVLAVDMRHVHFHQFVGIPAVLGPHHQLEVGEVLVHRLHEEEVGFGIVDGGDQDLGFVCTCGLEQVGTGGIAVVDLEAHAAQQVHPVGVMVENGGMDAVGPEKAPDGAAVVGESRDDDGVFFLHRIGLALGLFQGAESGQEEFVVGQDQQGCQGHAEGRHSHHHFRGVLVEDLELTGKGIRDEGKLADLVEADGEDEVLVQAHLVGLADAEEHEGLDKHDAERDGDHEQGLVEDQPEVDGSPHGDKEESEQQSLEGLEVALQLMFELRVGQDHTREESPQGRGEADRFHEEGDAHHDQQGTGDEEFPQARPGNQAQQRHDGVPSQEDDEAHRADDEEGLQPAGDLGDKAFMSAFPA